MVVVVIVVVVVVDGEYKGVPHSWKIWWELNLADWPKPAQTKIFADFNLGDDQA